MENLEIMELSLDFISIRSFFWFIKLWKSHGIFKWIDRSSSYYPVALIPGQFTDYYREYTPAELRYYPLNTVLYGPMKPNEQKFDSQSEGSQSDSDSDSSSDDSRYDFTKYYFYLLFFLLNLSHSSLKVWLINFINCRL